MRRLAIVIFIVIGLFVSALGSLAQGVETKAYIDTNDVLIGDRVQLTLEARSDKKTNIVFPSISDSIGKLEVLEKSLVDTIEQDGGVKYVQRFTLTSFDSGRYAIPPLTVMYEKKGMGEMYPEATEPIEVLFNTVKVDMKKGIKSIKDPLEEPMTLADYLPYIGIFLGILAVLAAIYYFYVKRKPKDLLELDYDPSVPAHVEALEALQKLSEEKLWQSGQVKEYYIRLTNIIRVYIKRRYEINALEATSGEILQAVSEKGVEEERVEKMRTVFENADFAKFAKFLPEAETNKKCYDLCVDFVRKTARTERETEEEVSSADSERSERIREEGEG